MERGRAALPRVCGAQERVSVCMSVRACVYVRVCVLICACTRVCVHICVLICLCMRVCALICECTHVCVHMCACLCARIRAGLPNPGVVSRMGCQHRGQAGVQTDRQTLGVGREQTLAWGEAATAIAATSSHQSVTGAGWSHLLHGKVIWVTLGFHIWMQGDPRKLLGPAASPPEETGQLGAAWPPRLAASGRQWGRSMDPSPRRPRKWQIPVLRRLLVGLEMAVPPSPATLLESMEFITLTYFLFLSF